MFLGNGRQFFQELLQDDGRVDGVFGALRLEFRFGLVAAFFDVDVAIAAAGHAHQPWTIGRRLLLLLLLLARSVARLKLPE